MFLLLFGLLFAAVVALSTGAGEVALSAILGVVGTFLTQVIKRAAKTDGNAALILTVVVSGVLGFISAWSVGEWNGTDVAGSIAVVFSLSTIAYRFFLSTDRVTNTPTKVTEEIAEKIDGDGQ